MTMPITCQDVLSLRAGRTIRGTCHIASISISTHEFTQGFSKGSIKAIEFSRETVSDVVELRTGKILKGALAAQHDKIFFTPVGEEDEQVFLRDDIALLVFGEPARREQPEPDWLDEFLSDEDDLFFMAPRSLAEAMRSGTIPVWPGVVGAGRERNHPCD